MQQRKQFIDAYMKQESSLSELCRRFGISRKTGYKWVGRFLAGCELGDRSRRPHSSPTATSAWLEDAIVTARRQRPRWGLRKLRAAIRSDDGSPFASKAPAGLSELSAWWLKLGITHERIEPGKPQQNGRHERMHLTLNLDTAMPPCGSRRAQQRAFDRFRRQYNEERPHEALGNRVPAEFFELSARRLPDPYWGRDFAYPEDYETTRVRKSRSMSWNDRSVFISTTLRHALLGLAWTGHGKWNVYFGKLRIGTSASAMVSFDSLLLGSSNWTDLTTLEMPASRSMHADAPCSGACHGACSWRSIAGASPEQPPRQAPPHRLALLRLSPMSLDHS